MYASSDSVPGTPVELKSPPPQSKQAPRHIRLGIERAALKQLNPTERSQETSTFAEPGAKAARRPSSTGDRIALAKSLRPHAGRTTKAKTSTAEDAPAAEAGLVMTCHARTRVPTPHGDVLLHVYKNNRDAKEHLAFVFDRAQLQQTENGAASSFNPEWIRSASLNAVWHGKETADERIVRGAYVGRLSPEHAVASTSAQPMSDSAIASDPPLVRIHSECFTGETIGSQRCDCGEQLDEAFRLISTCPEGRGVIVYLRQEGRGIGLLEKVRAYNLQDLGHDTVSANLLLGHGADMRTYDLAAGILKDLGIDQVRLLTNNPDKMQQAEKEGVRVAERVSMVPRSWRKATERQDRRNRRQANRKLQAEAAASMETSSGREDDGLDSIGSNETTDSEDERTHLERSAGVGMIGASQTDSKELDRYLRTKIERMGHMLDMPSPAASEPDNERQFFAQERKPRPRQSKPRVKKERLMDSVASLHTDVESLNCSDEGAGWGSEASVEMVRPEMEGATTQPSTP